MYFFTVNRFLLKSDTRITVEKCMQRTNNKIKTYSILLFVNILGVFLCFWCKKLRSATSFNKLVEYIGVLMHYHAENLYKLRAIDSLH